MENNNLQRPLWFRADDMEMSIVELAYCRRAFINREEISITLRHGATGKINLYYENEDKMMKDHKKIEKILTGEVK